MLTIYWQNSFSRAIVSDKRSGEKAQNQEESTLQSGREPAPPSLHAKEAGMVRDAVR